MILETVKIEPFVFYKETEKLKEDFYNIIGSEKIKELRELRDSLIKKGIIIKRTGDFSINEVGKIIFLYKTIWRSEEDRIKNQYTNKEINRLLKPQNWWIEEIKIEKMPGNYKNWIKDVIKSSIRSYKNKIKINEE